MSLVFHSDFENTLVEDGWTGIMTGDSSISRSEEAAKLHSMGLNILRSASTSGMIENIVDITLEPGESFFAGFWMRINELEPTSQNSVELNSVYADSSLRTYTQIYADGRLRFCQYSDDGLETGDDLTWDQGWHHYIHEYQRALSSGADGAYRVYRDGVLVLENINRTFAAFDSSSWTFDFGAMVNSGDCGIDFDIDDVRIGETLEDVFPADSYLIYSRENKLLQIASLPVSLNFARNDFPLSLYWQGYQDDRYFLSRIFAKPKTCPADLMLTPMGDQKYELFFSFHSNSPCLRPSAFDVLIEESGPATDQSPVLTTLLPESEEKTEYAIEIELQTLPVWLAVRAAYADEPGSMSDSLFVKSPETLSSPAVEIL